MPSWLTNNIIIFSCGQVISKIVVSVYKCIIFLIQTHIFYLITFTINKIIYFIVEWCIAMLKNCKISFLTKSTLPSMSWYTSLTSFTKGLPNFPWVYAPTSAFIWTLSNDSYISLLCHTSLYTNFDQRNSSTILEYYYSLNSSM